MDAIRLFFLVTLENDTQVLLTELLILGFGAYFGLTPMQQQQCRNGKDFSTAYKQFHICILLIYNKIFHPVHEHAERMMVWQSLNAVNFYSSHQSASSSKFKKKIFLKPFQQSQFGHNQNLRCNFLFYRKLHRVFDQRLRQNQAVQAWSHLWRGDTLLWECSNEPFVGRRTEM